MQIQNYSNTNFKGLQCHPNYAEVQYNIATKYGWNYFDKTMKIIDELAKKKANTDIYLAGDLENPDIYVDIAGKTIKENIFYGAYSVVKKALKLANKIDKEA